MASTTSTALRRMLEDRVGELIDEAGRHLLEAAAKARCDCADELNQAARRINQASSREELFAILVDAAAKFASGAALLTIHSESALTVKVRGLSESQSELLRAAIPLESAPALADAVVTRGPVFAAQAPSQVGLLAEAIGQTPEDRAAVFPIFHGDTVPALLYVWGPTQPAALELLAQVTSPAWVATMPMPEPETPPDPDPAPDPFPEPPAAAPTSASDLLPAPEQAAHLRAQRFARVQAAEMRLYETEAVQLGRSRADLYRMLSTRIDRARREFQEKFLAATPGMADYLHLELVHTLANDDPELLGRDYPGPLA